MIAAGAGCSSSNNKPNIDGGLDGLLDRPKDMAPADTATDTAQDTPADMAPVDAPDAADGPTPGSITQKLTQTVIVVDQIGGDGGYDGPQSADGGVDGAPLPTVDPNLVNAWGLGVQATDAGAPPDALNAFLWVADNGTGVSTVYSPFGQVFPPPTTIPVPPDGGVPPSAPTGLVLNASATAFMADKVIFATEDGTIAGWQGGASATLRVDSSSVDAVYKGLTIATMNGVPRLYATDFHNAKVTVWDQTYATIVPTGGFTDATLPAGFAPFGIQSSASLVWVTYAKQDAMKHDDVAGVGNGYLDVFDFNGTFVKRLISAGALNSPWAMVVAPADFGAFSNALLVGNFGDGHINAYDVATGFWRGPALDVTGAPLKIDGLWSLVFGDDAVGAPHNRLFYTAGPIKETHGQLGHLDLP
jgi:uncharacterized protein (TIGR03118 family)